MRPEKDNSSDHGLLWFVLVILAFSHCGANDEIGDLQGQVGDLEREMSDLERDFERIKRERNR